jgi:hypothetical protein
VSPGDKLAEIAVNQRIDSLLHALVSSTDCRVKSPLDEIPKRNSFYFSGRTTVAAFASIRCAIDCISAD